MAKKINPEVQLSGGGDCIWQNEKNDYIVELLKVRWWLEVTKKVLAKVLNGSASWEMNTLTEYSH